jgi:ubiquinone/menaquinone biosynthesis C-methylase UbiE
MAVNQAEYEYWGLMASTWDLLLGGDSEWEDALFFRELIARQGQPVLEVGCGTGRLLLAYLAQGIDIDGLDNSPEMLALCRDKAQKRGLHPVLFQQAMENLALPRRYRLIIVPASSFQLVIEPAMAAQTMRRFLAHLEPGGMLAMRFIIPWHAGNPVQTDWRLTGEAVRLEDGAMVRRWSRAKYEVEPQLAHTEERYELTDRGQVITSEYHRRSPAMRWYTPAQALTLFQQTGFTRLDLLEGGDTLPVSAKRLIFSLAGQK